MKVPRRRLQVSYLNRSFSSTRFRSVVRDLAELPDRIQPSYKETSNDFLSLRWPSRPRNILLVKKDGSRPAMDAVVDFAKHIITAYPPLSLIAEPRLATSLHGVLPVPVFTALDSPTDRPLSQDTRFHHKTDLIATFGGDGTILHASSLFSTASSVPPLLAFSMGTLGFLGEYKFVDYKRAFHEAYMSGASNPATSLALGDSSARQRFFEDNDDAGEDSVSDGWDTLREQFLGARVLLRHRLKVAVFDPADALQPGPVAIEHHAMNEVLLYRGSDPHLARISIFVNGRFLTEAVADGILVSTPTGSTAYALSAGGSIIHPLVPSLLLTPICPRSLSFRSLVLPANVEIVLKLGKTNRGREVELSIDGERRKKGVAAGMEVKVTGEEIKRSDEGWTGGVPCLMRGDEKGGDDGWVDSLNGLLGFNYPFGER